MYRKRGFKQLVKGIAFGLLILHRNHIIHGDLHLANVLLKVNANHDILRVMLCDFGMTRISRLLLQEPNSTSVQPWVSFKPGYAPPENRTAEQSPEAPGDVFSFAIAMWHWVQERPPTSHEAPNGTLPEKMPNAWKEIVMEDEDEDGMYSLARWMTDADPKKRPTIEVVMRELRRLGYV
ncbi:kinase-like protein [Clavulina sp. PMI_390]|nr:kinase-like protein [Clavulina sp. PMI_390]